MVGFPEGNSRLFPQFLATQLTHVCSASYREYFSCSVFHEQVLYCPGMEVACGNGIVHFRTSHTMMMMMFHNR